MYKLDNLGQHRNDNNAPILMLIFQWDSKSSERSSRVSLSMIALKYFRKCFIPISLRSISESPDHLESGRKSKDVSLCIAACNPISSSALIERSDKSTLDISIANLVSQMPALCMAIGSVMGILRRRLGAGARNSRKFVSLKLLEGSELAEFLLCGHHDILRFESQDKNNWEILLLATGLTSLDAPCDGQARNGLWLHLSNL